MKHFKNYLRRFAKDESGIELLQFAVIVVITAGLIAVAMKIKNVISGGLEGSTNILIDGFGEAGVNLDSNGNVLP